MMTKGEAVTTARKSRNPKIMLLSRHMAFLPSRSVRAPRFIERRVRRPRPCYFFSVASPRAFFISSTIFLASFGAAALPSKAVTLPVARTMPVEECVSW